jgi:C4-dicarboxylate-specific signal transduction histidine kinase
VTFAAHHFNRTFVAGVRLNLVLGERTEQLTKRTEALTAANLRLEAEIAQRKVAEDQLHQAKKLGALGQLTGGIPHDFNNLLTAVIGNLELAQNRLGSDPQMANLLRAALSAAERGAALVRDLLAFARRQPLQPRQVNVAAVVDDALKILKPRSRDGWASGSAPYTGCSRGLTAGSVRVYIRLPRASQLLRFDGPEQNRRPPHLPPTNRKR